VYVEGHRHVLLGRQRDRWRGGEGLDIRQVSADVSANFQKTRTTERSTSPSFKLPPRSKRYCFDGVDFERYKVRRCTLSSYDPGNNHCRVKLFRAPAIQTWRITTKNVHSGSA
jgi:hypothetical protein